MRKELKKLKAIHSIHDGSKTFEESDYMRGYYNGLEMALAVFEHRKPKYKTKGGSHVG